MQFTTPDMREITISDKSEACDFIKDSCKECNRKYECTGENAAFCNHMKNPCSKVRSSRRVFKRIQN